MTIWRGEGGGGDATTDSEINFITSLTNSIAADIALTSANAAAVTSLYDSFDDRYLGSKTAAPTLDNDSNALISGALYWNSVSNQMFVWSGVAWQQTFFSGTNVRSVVTATAGQTVVTTPAYTLSNNTIQVYVNGFKVISGTDYSETNTTSITFTSGLTLGDEVEIIIAQPFSVGTTSASNVNYIPSGTLSAVTAQAAIDELASEKVQSATLAASGGSSLVGYLPSGTGAVASTVQTKLRESVSVKDFGAVGDGATDDSAAVQAAATAAKASGSALYFVKSVGSVYAINNVDISGLDVFCHPNVSITSPAGATGRAFLAAGTALARVTTPTRIYDFVHTGGNSQFGLLYASYCDDVFVSNCFGSNYPIAYGECLQFVECIRPLVIGGKMRDGRTGVQFTSCTTPAAIGVKTEHQGRDGIAFYTAPTGTTTTDAMASMCVATDYCVTGEAGRAGIHFYGTRRATAVGCTASNDNAQTFDDTSAIRFRDCEDFSCTDYTAFNCRVGVLVNEVGDYVGTPHNIVSRGSIGSGNVDTIGKCGIFVTGGSSLECSITGARVSNVADITLAAGISHGGIGSVTGCVLSDMACRGIDVTGLVTVSGNTLERCGKGSTNIGAVFVGASAVVSSNFFVDDRGGSATSTLAIRVSSGATAVIGENFYGAGITDFVVALAGSTIKRDSTTIRQKFGGVPGSLAGTIEAGVTAVDTNGIIYVYQGGSWRRTTPKALGIQAIGITQTTIAHGLGYTPVTVTLTPLANAVVWESAIPDATNVYLTASLAINVKISVQ